MIYDWMNYIERRTAEAYDANGQEISKLACWIDTETGKCIEIIQNPDGTIPYDENGYVLHRTVMYPAPILVKFRGQSDPSCSKNEPRL